MTKKVLPALKKSDLLAGLKDKDGENRTDLTKDILQAELAKKFAFMDEYFGYLFAMYAAGGKFDIDEDTGIMTIKVMGQVRTSPRTIFTLAFAYADVEVEYEDGTEGTESQMVITADESTLMPGDKLPEGSSLSPASAAKLAKTAAYQVYKDTLTALEEWVAEQKTEASEEEQQEAA